MRVLTYIMSPLDLFLTLDRFYSLIDFVIEANNIVSLVIKKDRIDLLICKS